MLLIIKITEGYKMEKKKQVRAHAIITGRVQGVFFRVETQRTAQKYGVFGWVRNKADGSVEAVIEGDENKVISVLEWCKNGPPTAVVGKVDVNWETYTGEFKDFRILR